MAIVDLCEALDIQLSDVRREQIASLEEDGLNALRTAIKKSKAWPTDEPA